MAQRWFVLGALLGATAVALGAFGAHGLKSRVAPEMLAVWKTGAEYHLAHALALLAAGLACERWPGGWTAAAGWLFVAGIVLFSGSLYALVLTGQRGWGAVTPLGGVAFITGWIALAFGAWRGK